MIALDTNVLARYIVRDEPKQAAAATTAIESSCSAEKPGVVTLVTLCELVWVLDRGYGYTRRQIAGVLRALLSAAELSVERFEIAWRALNGYEDGRADFADYAIGLCARDASAEVTLTFDRLAAESSLFRLVE